MYREILDAYIENHKEEMIEDLKTLVRIDSQKMEAKEGMPYGEGPAKVLDAAAKMMESYGFKVNNYGNRVVTGDIGDQEKYLDILAHLDVVPVTDNWKETSPFDPVVKDGKIYGRGTVDDKGPAIAALYAMRAIKESGIELAKNVRLILGSDEECGSSDLEYYYSVEKEAPMSFTPDAEYPVINIEKGRLEKGFSKKAVPGAGAVVLEVCGGTKSNVVPDTARALVSGLDESVIRETAEKMNCGIDYLVETQEGACRVTAKGLAAHASTPECGHNAISGLLKLLAALPLTENECSRAFCDLAECFPAGDHNGAALGIAMEDETSGKLTLNIGILSYDGETISGVIDSRVPICGNDENVTNVFAAKLESCGFEVEEGSMIPPHCVPGDSELVQKLLASYERYSGIKGEPIAIGGGTYVHHLQNGVAFGCIVEGVDNHMHGDDEFMEIDVLMMSTKIFADAILSICGE